MYRTNLSVRNLIIVQDRVPIPNVIHLKDAVPLNPAILECLIVMTKRSVLPRLVLNI